MAPSFDKEALSADLADARTRLTGNLRALRYDLAIVPRLKSSMARNRLAWFAGAALLGLLLSQLAPSRRPAGSPRAASRSQAAGSTGGKAALAATVLKIVLDFVKPVILRYLREWIRSRASAPRP